MNTPVLVEALQRYELGLLPLSMRRWVETLLELPPADRSPQSACSEAP
ncbi:hypothetical protein [Cyanobium sp. ATX-6F1]